MILDLRYPFLVILGHWNSSVSNPQWVRTVPFQLSDGEKRFLFQVQPSIRDPLDSEQYIPEVGSVYYHTDVGISCDTNQLEGYTNKLNDETINHAETIIKRIIELFPYTLYRPTELTFGRLDLKFNIAATVFRSKFFKSEEYDINFRRLLDNEGVELAFNFHYSADAFSELCKISSDLYCNFFTKLLTLLPSSIKLIQSKTLKPLITISNFPFQRRQLCLTVNLFLNAN